MTMTAYAPYTGERGKLPGVISATTTEDKQTVDMQPSIVLFVCRRWRLTTKYESRVFIFSQNGSFASYIQNRQWCADE